MLTLKKSGETWPGGVYTANFKANTYTIKFEANGGEGTVKDETVSVDQTKYLRSNEFTKEGLTFNGWNTAADGTGTAYDNEQAVKNLTLEDGQVITLYAQWAAHIIVNYDSNQCRIADSDFLIPENAQYATEHPYASAKTGYRFMQWEDENRDTYESSGGSTLLLEKPDTGWQNTIYYAIMEKVEIKVFYRANGGSGEMDDQNMTYGQDYNLLENKFTNGDQAFLGWSTKENGSGHLYRDGAQVRNLEGGLTSVYLYAVWDTGNKLQFISNDPSMGYAAIGTIEMKNPDDQWIVEAEAYSGYHFVNWTDEEGNVIPLADYVSDKSAHCIGIPDGGWKVGVYTANFAPNKYIVKFDANDGSGDTAEQEFTYGQEEALIANTFTRDGYTFSNWKEYLHEDIYQDGQIVSNLSSTNNDKVYLNAVWKLDEDAVKVEPVDPYFNGSAQDLLKYSIPKGLTIRFTQDGGETLSSKIPQATEVGKYTIEYRVTDKEGNRINGSVTSNIKQQPLDQLTLATTAYTYNGSAKTPAVTVKNEAGETLEQDRDYTVAYTDNQNIGTATVTVTGAGDYTGSLEANFDINPAKVSITTPKAGKKKITVKWKKSSGGVYYKVAYKIKGAKAWKYTTSKTTYKTIKKLKRKKYYYVRVKAYKVVNETTYEGEWSKIKKCKVK